MSLAPDFVKDLKLRIPIDCYRYLDLDDESKELAETYLKEKILGKASLDDAYHFDTVKFFRAIKEKLAARMANMTIEEQREFLKQVREGKIKIA